MGYRSTLASFNRTCRDVRLETLPTLWKTVIVKRIHPVGRTGGYQSYTPKEYLEFFKPRYGREEQCKYIKQMVDQDDRLRTDIELLSQTPGPTTLFNPFRDATILRLGAKAPPGS
ncbi:hypothetical protein NCC49_005262 [Naganishia albida]|nr:hypothetical protein NCC49_005262 [Naganishia albida]